MKIGFTGTQQGMTDSQKNRLDAWLALHSSNIDEFHHGDCVGADEEANALSYWCTSIVVHPPDIDTKRAFCKGIRIKLLPPKPYLERNHDIVDACDLLIVTPKSPIEELRSGTWSTWRYAVKTNKDWMIIYPDGSTKRK